MNKTDADGLLAVSLFGLILLAFISMGIWVTNTSWQGDLGFRCSGGGKCHEGLVCKKIGTENTRDSYVCVLPEEK